MNYVESLNLFGVEAKEIPCIRGSGAPTATTGGAVGCLYMNTDNGDMYKCVSMTDAGCVWEEVGGGGSVAITDDGNGNVTLSSKALTVTDDDNGNVTLT